jgi:hypothetical protein
MGTRKLFAVTYIDQCNTCVVYYGTGCYNVDLGWGANQFYGLV